MQAEQASHAQTYPKVANYAPACAEGSQLCRVQAAVLGEEHEATLRTRMGLVNVLAETDRGEMAEDICRRVEEVC